MAQFLKELLLNLHDLVEGLDHVYWNTNRTSLISDRAGDCLANPPCRVGREFVAAAVFEFLNRFHEAHVTFLN